MAKEIFDRWFGRLANAATMWTLIPATAVGIVTAYLSRGVEWIDQFGAFGWWTAGLLGFLLAALALALVGVGVDKWTLARATRKWAKNIDEVNPLDREFTRKRIPIAHLAHPVKKTIKGKRFTKCELIGPATIVFRGSGLIRDAGFINCDVVIVRPGTGVFNAAVLEDCTILEGEIVNCSIYVDQAMFDKSFRAMGVTPITFEAPADDSKKE